MKQNIGSYQIDVATRQEASQDMVAALGHHMDAATREHYRGVKALKLPTITGTATGATFSLPSSGGSEPVQCGPQSGYFWRVQRITIASSGADVGAASLFAGSDPGNLSNQFLIDNTLKVGQAYYPGNRGLYLWPGEVLYVSFASVATNTYRLMGLAVEVPAEMQAKLMTGA